jgi:hypothetical protein
MANTGRESILERLQARIKGLREEALKQYPVNLIEYKKLREEASALDGIHEAVKRGHDRVALRIIQDGLIHLDNDEMTALVSALK